MTGAGIYSGCVRREDTENISPANYGSVGIWIEEGLIGAYRSAFDRATIVMNCSSLTTYFHDCVEEAYSLTAPFQVIEYSTAREVSMLICQAFLKADLEPVPYIHA